MTPELMKYCIHRNLYCATCYALNAWCIKINFLKSVRLYLPENGHLWSTNFKVLHEKSNENW